MKASTASCATNCSIARSSIRSSEPRSSSSAGVITTTIAGHTRPSDTGRQRQAHGSSRCRTPAPLRHGYAGVRLNQNPIPLLHKTRLRSRGPVSDPSSLLAFPKLTLAQKLRYGAMMLVASKRNRPGKLETLSAKAWIMDWCGKTVYDRLWAPLFEYNFYEYADNISAAWIWTRNKRVGTSRRSLLQEELEYIQGLRDFHTI